MSEREKLYIAASHEAMATGNMEAARKTYELWEQLYPAGRVCGRQFGRGLHLLGEFDEASRRHPGGLET